jgi:flagellar assembly protein FliH
MPDIVEKPVVVPETEQLLDKAKAEAEAILAEASNEASQRLAQAEKMIDQIKEQAHQEGYQAGYEHGVKQGIEQGKAAGLEIVKNKIESASEQANNILANAEKQAGQTLFRAEHQIVEIALGIARKILVREIEENPMTILPVVRAALEKIRDQEEVTIRANPEDIEIVNHAKRDLQQIIGGDKRLTITPDHTVNPGGCVIDTKNGTVDASIDTQFQLIKQALQDVLP